MTALVYDTVVWWKIFVGNVRFSLECKSEVDRWVGLQRPKQRWILRVVTVAETKQERLGVGSNPLTCPKATRGIRANPGENFGSRE